MKLTDFAHIQKNVILNIAILALALLISRGIYKSQNQEINKLISQKTSEVQKNEALRSLSKTEKLYNAYKSLLKKSEGSFPIDSIGEMARETGIKLVSIEPSGDQDFSVYARRSFSISINANNYHALGEFIAKLENSDDIYIVDSLNIKTNYADKVNERSDRISADLRLSSIMLKSQ